MNGRKKKNYSKFKERRSRCNVIGIATNYEPDRRWFESSRDFSLPPPNRQSTKSVGAPRLLANAYQRCFSGLKRPRHTFDPSRITGAEVGNGCCSASLLPICLRSMDWNIFVLLPSFGYLVRTVSGVQKICEHHTRRRMVRPTVL